MNRYNTVLSLLLKPVPRPVFGRLALGVGAATVPLVALTHDLGGGFATLFATLAALAFVIALAVLVLPSERRPEAVPSAGRTLVSGQSYAQACVSGTVTGFFAVPVKPSPNCGVLV